MIIIPDNNYRAGFSAACARKYKAQDKVLGERSLTRSLTAIWLRDKEVSDIISILSESSSDGAVNSDRIRTWREWALNRIAINR